MRRLVVLHTNDIHGRVDAIARIATVVERASSATEDPVLYVDAGDVEDRTDRLSNLTKGIAVHRLLGIAGAVPRRGLDVTWDGTTIIREEIEEHLRRHPVVDPPAARIHGGLANASV